MLLRIYFFVGESINNLEEVLKIILGANPFATHHIHLFQIGKNFLAAPASPIFFEKELLLLLFHIHHPDLLLVGFDVLASEGSSKDISFCIDL